MKIWQKIVLGFGLALVMLATVAIITYRSTSGLMDTAAWVAQRHEIIDQLESLRLHLVEVDSAARGYLLAADEQYLPAYQDARQKLVDDYNRLKITISQSGEEEADLEQIQPLLAAKTAIVKQAIEARQGLGLAAAAAMLGDGKDEEVTKRIGTVIDRLASAETERLELRASLSAEIGHSSTSVVLMATVLSAVILTLATLLILRDIAVRRRAEEVLAEEHNLLRSVMDAMPEQVYVTDREGRFLIDNISHRRFLGVKLAAEVEGKVAADFFPKHMAEEMARDELAITSSGRPVIDHEHLVLRDDEGVVWLSTTKVPLNDMEGNCVGLVSVSSDISIRKESEERLRVTAEQLRKSNSELQEFASVASHDLQEPLRKIQAFGDRLKVKCSDAIGESGRDYLERMQDAARRMQILLQDLLTLSRVTSKAQPFESVALEKVVAGVMSDLEVRIEQTGAQLEIGFLPVIDADPAQMRQLFQNLISNALKFRRHGVPPEVIISAKLFDNAETIPGAMPGEEICQIVISDNGIGFDEKYLDRIFQVFQRLHSRSEYEGTGIGLAVCRKIAERHGGMISAKSTAGEGATFIVTLPVKQRIPEPDEEVR